MSWRTAPTGGGMGRLLEALLVPTCAEVGHHWKHLGGCNAGCDLDRDCTCSIPVHECRRCGDCDYGENREGRRVRADCARHRYDNMTPNEARRWLAGRDDWGEREWQDHCGDPDCEQCQGDIPAGNERLAAERKALLRG